MPYIGVDIFRYRKRVQENVPVRGGEPVVAAHENKEHQSQHDHDHRRAVAAPREGRKHEREVPEEKHREDKLRRHLERGHRVEQYPGNVGKNNQDEVVRDVDHQHPRAPHLVTVVGDTENNFQDPVVLVILYTEHHRVKNKQQAGEQQ